MHVGWVKRYGHAFLLQPSIYGLVCQCVLLTTLTFSTRCNYVLYLSIFGLRLLTKQVLSQFSFWTPVFLMWQSVPEVDPAANMHNSQSQQRMSTSSYSSSSPTAYSAPQAPALNVTGPITANSEQVLGWWFFWVRLFQQIQLETDLQRNFHFNSSDFDCLPGLVLLSNLSFYYTVKSRLSICMYGLLMVAVTKPHNLIYQSSQRLCSRLAVILISPPPLKAQNVLQMQEVFLTGS